MYFDVLKYIMMCRREPQLLTYNLFRSRHENRFDVMENLHHRRLDGFQHVAPIRGHRVRRFFQHAFHVSYERYVNVSYQLK